jgi:ribonuclease HI
MKDDPGKILKDLAVTLDVRKTLENFPKLTSKKLADIVKIAADIMTEVDTQVVLFVDGGARGNPGPAGCGFVIQAGDEILVRKGEYIDVATNNVAEYRALILGLEAASRLNIKELTVKADSELVVKQMTGQYRVKNENLRMLFASAQAVLKKIDKVSFVHIPRGENKEADKLANMAIDAKGPVSL